MNESNRPFFRKIHPATPVDPIALAVTALKPGRYKLTVRRTGYLANDAYTPAMALGLPTDLSTAQIAQSQALTADKPEDFWCGGDRDVEQLWRREPIVAHRTRIGDVRRPADIGHIRLDRSHCEH